MAERWVPPLRLHASDGRCRLWLGAIACGEGDSLQLAADRLISKLRTLAVEVRHGGLALPADLGRAEPRVLRFLWELADLVARGEDIRDRVLGAAPEPGA
jgi:hypothetical protein